MSLRQIGVSAGISPSTVHDYVSRATTAGLTTWESIFALDEETLESRLFKVAEAISAKKKHPQPNWGEIHLELRRPGVTLELLWQEYREEYTEGLGRTQFSDYYRAYKKKLSVVMRQCYSGGKWGFVDFSGNKIPVINPLTNEEWGAELFVAALGASSYTFVCATASQELPCWLQAHVEMYEYFHGAPALTVTDNLKSGVAKACRYDPEANRSYQDLAEHYGTCVYPTRVYSPRDKAKAEAAVLVAQRWIIAVLRNRRFYSLAEINAAIRNECLEKINTRTMRHFGKSRRELWELYDRPHLKELPITRYEYASWKRATLNIDYHVVFEQHYYSAPFRLVREEVWLRATAQTVEIFHKGKRVASHLRSFIPHKSTTDSAHMPESHRHHTEWSPSRIIQWAGKNGKNCSELVKKILESKKHPELGYRAALGVIRLGNKFGADRLDKACLKALSIDSPAYRTVQSILKNRTEEEAAEELETTLPVSPENLRGPKYYH